MDRGKMITIVLFVVGALLVGVGNGIVVEPTDGFGLGIALSLAGGAVLGVSRIAAFRWKTGPVTVRRKAALVGSFLVVGAGSVVAAMFASSEIEDYRFLGVFILVFLFWLHTYREETNVTRTDERLQLLAYKAGYWTLVTIIGFVRFGMGMHEFTSYTLSSEMMLAIVAGIGLFGWYGAFRYFQTHH